MGYTPEVEREYRRYNRKESGRRIVLIILAVVMGVLLLGAGYLYYDYHRDIKFSKDMINLQKLEQSFSRMSGDTIDLEPVSFDYRKGGNQATVHVLLSDANQSLKDTECPKCSESGKQLHFDCRETQDAELLLWDIYYMQLYYRLMSAVGLERADRGNLYLSRYGEELAKGKPNYPYLIEFSMQKGDRNYAVYCYASDTTFLNEIIDEIATRCPMKKE